MKQKVDFLKNKLPFYVWIFLICSFLGWLIELFFRTRNAGWVLKFPGFLYGCYLPIYGFGALIMAVFFEDLSLKKIKLLCINFTPFIIFACSFVVLSVMEYFTHYAIDEIFDMRLWSYRAHPYNINGRVSLEQSLMFASGGTIFIYLLYPVLKRMISKVNLKVLRWVALLIVLMIGTDFVISTINYLK